MFVPLEDRLSGGGSGRIEARQAAGRGAGRG